MVLANLHGERNVIANFDPSLPPTSEAPTPVMSCDVMSVVSPRVTSGPRYRGPHLPWCHPMTTAQRRPPSGSVGDLLQNWKLAELFLASMSFGQKEFFCKQNIWCSYSQSSNGAQSFLAEVISLLSLMLIILDLLWLWLIVNTRHFCFRELRQSGDKPS